MVNKPFAYYFDSTSNEIKCIIVYDALKLKHSLIMNIDKDIIFWDEPDFSKAGKVFPKRSSTNGSRSAHFCYYPGMSHSGTYSEMTMTHKLYQIAYAKVSVLLLYAYGEQIKIYIKRSRQNFTLNTSKNRYFIDIMFDLEKTEPASYYYKWNGKLAFEIYVTHHNPKSKTNDLTLEGIQIFQAKIFEDKRVPEDFNDDEEYEYYRKLVEHEVFGMNHKAVGDFLNSVFPMAGSDMEKEYLILANFEDEQKKLKDTIKKQEENFKLNVETLNKMKTEYNKMLTYMNECKDKLKSLSDHEKILQSNDELKKQNEILLKQIKTADTTISELKENLNEEKNKKISQRLALRLVEKLQHK